MARALWGKISNFGGVDMNVLCTEDEPTIRSHAADVLEAAALCRGIAVESDNQIADYVPTESSLAMVAAVREFRGDE